MPLFPPLDVVLRIVLLPVLIWQGVRVRRNALVLPEAAGPRVGAIGHGPVLRLLIVGDSSGAGVGVADQSDALCGQLVKALAEHKRVTWRLVARTGATSKSITAMLNDEPASSYDVAVLALGVNDAVRLLPLSLWRRRQSHLRSILRDTFDVGLILATAVPPLEHFPALPRLLQWVLGSHARRMDEGLERDLVGERGAQHVKIDLPFSIDAMAKDGYHPSAYTLWAQTMAKRILAADEKDI